jgi:hypothetical protein
MSADARRQKAQLKSLSNALLSAFPTREGLEQLCSFALGCPLEQVVMGGGTSWAVLKLIQHAESQGQLEELVHEALELRPGNIALKAHVAIYLDNVFSLKEQQDLGMAARGGGFTKEVLLACFRQSWPARGPGSPPGVPEEALLDWLIKELADVHMQTDGRIPLFTFAELLQRRAQGAAVASALETWRAEAMSQRGMEAKPLLQQVLPETMGSDSPLFLLLRIEVASKGQCTVQAWLSVGELGAMKSIHADDEPRDLRSVETLLSRLREKISDDLAAADNRLVIEVMLPQQLLCHAVERWELEQGRYKVFCGCKFPVVVRSWERVYDKLLVQQMRPSWVQKWKALEEQLPSVSQEAVVWEPDASEARELFERLSETGVVCLALLHPQEEGSAATSPELSACIDSGTPVALWERKRPGEQEERREEVARLVADLGQLRTRVHALRVEARKKEGEGHVGHSLVLLWDNPHRVPPDVSQNSRLMTPPTT